jgi:hypothetical protein
MQGRGRFRGKARDPHCETRRFALRIRAFASMNSASQDLTHHLSILLGRLQHPTDYERAFHYFLEEFGGDRAFIAMGEVERAPNLVEVLNGVATSVLGRRVEVEHVYISLVPGHGFHHGSARVDGRAVICFYFDSANCGLVAIIPGAGEEAAIGRFRLPGSQTASTGLN